VKLDGKTNAELLAMKQAIEDAPENRTPPGSFFKLTRAALRKMDAIDRQITHNLAMKRAAEGNPVPCDGYSGRKQNRRR
jgi:hypothetical protein